MRYLLNFILCMSTHIIYAQTPSKFIHVDQFGYLTDSNKVAVISNPQVGHNAADSYTPSSNLQLRNSNDDELVMTVEVVAWNNLATHSQSGDQGWWVDFSSLTADGTYYIYDEGRGERSADFEVNDDVYGDVLRAAGRMFYYNRCGMAKEAAYAGQWTDGMNFQQDTETRFIFDRENTALFKDLSGGWFDAGDYNKYVTFAHSTIHDLLSAYEENPGAFGDDWNIPESGNGIPDIIDEIKWELDWLFKMTNADGSVHIKMGAPNFSENTASPPSSNTQFPRYYGPTCSAASIAVASMFGHAYKVFSSVQALGAYANELQETAERCYAYAKTFVDSNTLETGCDDGSIVAGDADWNVDLQLENYLLASVYLFELTGNTDYESVVIANLDSLEPFTTTFWGPYKISLYDALFNYARLSNADVETRNKILTGFQSAVTNNFEGFFGFNTSDLYRAFIPDYSYHWGSSQSKASYGVLNSLVATSGIAIADTTTFTDYIDESLHYFHGVNPQGLVYLSNMYSFGAERSVNEIYHAWFSDKTPYDHALNSQYGPAPGFLSGGSNSTYTVSSVSPPFGQPLQKSYLDFNDGFPNNSWEISEPGIYYQAAYIRLLANRALASSTPADNDTDGDGVLNAEDQCADTPIGDVVDALGCTIFSLPATNYTITTIDASCPDTESGRLEIQTQENYNYTASLKGDTVDEILNFTTITNFDNLKAGTYQLCFTIATQAAYEQCFDITIDEPEPLSVVATIDAAANTVTFDLTGGNRYTIILNQERYTTEESRIELPLNTNQNIVKITTDSPCQGSYESTLVIADEPLMYPNPLGSNFLMINFFEPLISDVAVTVFDMGGKDVWTNRFEKGETSITLDLAALANDIYLVSVVGLGINYTYKLIK